jgi:hypothetical protein
MLGLLLSLLGLGSAGGIAAYIWPKAAMALLKGAKRQAKSITPRGWLYIGGAVAIVGGLTWHVLHERSRFKKAVAAAYVQGTADYAAKVEKHARQINERVSALVGPINQAIRDRHNEELGRIRADAGAIVLRGPGKAECRDPAFAVSSGGRDATGGSANAAVDRLPYPQWSALLAMPLDDAARFGAQHDAYRDEVKSWHEWWPKMNSAWEKLRAEVQGKGEKK